MEETFRVGDRVVWQQLEARPDKQRGRSWHNFERPGTVTELYRDPPWRRMARLTLDRPIMVTVTAGTGESVTDTRTDVRVPESALRNHSTPSTPDRCPDCGKRPGQWQPEVGKRRDKLTAEECRTCGAAWTGLIGTTRRRS